MSRFGAFISYSHSDTGVARWLHHKLETYRLPRALVGCETPFGPAERRLPPVFRDRDELPASGDLGEELRAALADSRFQIVLCSPKSAASHWVNEEILSFKAIHGEGRTLALIVAGEPYAGDDRECFPPALRFKVLPGGTLSALPAEPIAADIRPGKDGRRLAFLKLVAGVAGVRLDALVRRDAARRQRRLMWIAGAASVIALVTIGLAIYAESQRRVAVRQRQLADRSLEFLIDTFAIANPATENPRTITAITILDRASRRAGTELRDEPGVSARLLRATGEIYANLGLPREATRDLRAALGRLPARGEQRARVQLRLAALAYERGDAAASRAALAAAKTAIRPGARYADPVLAEVAERDGMTEIIEGRYAASAAKLGDAARLYEALDGDHRRDLARVWMNQAQSLLTIRRYGEANPLFARATATLKSLYGINHVRTANAIQNEALADFEQGRLADAAARAAEAVAVYDRVLEPDHPELGDALILMGRIQTAQGDAAGALSALGRARTIFARLYGPMNAAVGDTDFYAAEAESVAGRTDAALARVESAKRIYDRAYGPNDPDQVELLMLRSRVLAAGGRVDGARRACTAGLTLQVRLDPADPGIPDIRKACAGIASAAAPRS